MVSVIARLAALSAITVAFMLGVAPSAFADSDYEHIRDLRIQASVTTDGTIDVAESVSYHFATDAPKHGIFWFIQTSYPRTNTNAQQNDNKVRQLSISDFSANMDSHDVPFTQDTTDSAAATDYIAKIGDPQATVAGDHRYDLRYQIHGLLNKPSGNPELFWNILGFNNKIPVDRVEGTITAPGTISQIKCATGVGNSSTDRSCDSAGANGSTAQFSATNVNAYTALTVTTALPSNISVPEPIIRDKPAASTPTSPNKSAQDNSETPLFAFIIGGLGLLCGAWLIAHMLLGGRDHYYTSLTPGLLSADGTKSPEGKRWRTPLRPTAVSFTPPKGVPAAMCGMILRNRADKKAVAAVVTSLATRGLVKIAEEGKGFRITATGATDENLFQHEAYLLNNVIAPQKEGIAVPEQAALLGRELRNLPNQIYRAAHQLGWYTREPGKRGAAGYWGWGLTLVILTSWPLILWLQYHLIVAWIPFALTGILMMLLPRKALGRSAVGSATLDQVLNFRRYLEVAEAEQIAEEERQAIFNRYLPYAQAFGLAEHWAKKFAAIGAAVPGEWYSGASTNNTFVTSYVVYSSTVESSLGISSSSSSSDSWSSGDSSGFSSDSSSGSGGGDSGFGSW